MPLFRQLKVTALRAADKLGLFSRVAAGRWRQRRLLILCYHGISLDDEHEWSDAYISQAHLRRRFEILRELRCAVLPLGEALERMWKNDLPPRSVALTFDEGLYDFRRNALPLLEEFGFPTMLYVPTYYSRYQRPIFDLACSYFLWKGRGKEINSSRLLPKQPTLRIPVSDAERSALHLQIRTHTHAADYSADEKDEILATLCDELAIDWNAFAASRMLQLMTPEEFASLDPQYVDVQLHTHRHRTPRDERLFVRELEDNISALESMGFSRDRLRHFCYPSGDSDERFYPWLEARGIHSATTCEPQIADPDRHPLDLPRVIDTMGMSELEFRGWITGVSAFLPQRHKAWGDLDPSVYNATSASRTPALTGGRGLR